jgi:hypothetical protein
MDCKRGSVHAGQVLFRRLLKRLLQNMLCKWNRTIRLCWADGHNNENKSDGSYRTLLHSHFA